ncbi:SPOUT family RNA methylase [Thermococcus gammatolerans]|uniref:RNA-binding protein, putative n=1 Tax=Thermococcus gammatolerans (strain DSM 15229 / JCM 11827 / EJ3) TaxID=593117 RepID=C5A405_THEGJ|nr:SPOUT family RNA methylase [Thermococcus gammatolerans]ACS32967.1 RNA-binding protein, putative [Thermococcus gammatolerans EJ3]
MGAGRKFIVKTQRGMESVAANYISELLPKAEVWASPMGYSGLVLVESSDEDALEKILQIPEVERVIPVIVETEASLEKIAESAEKLADFIDENETYAVKTKRRGKHDFSSIDVNRVLGAKIKELTNADVNLSWPDKVVQVEIIGDRAYISVIPGEEFRKYTPDKIDARKLFKKLTIVQMPYWGDYKACRLFGEKIGRAAQAFEVKELIIAPKERMDAYELMEFIRGVKIGQESRYQIQRDAYPWNVEKVPVTVWDLYQVVRDKRRKKRLLIITDPKGPTLAEVKDKLAKDLHYAKEVVVFIGSREGIPKGLFRFADYVVDLAPYMTFATEHGIPAALVSLWEVYEEFLRGGEKGE